MQPLIPPMRPVAPKRKTGAANASTDTAQLHSAVARLHGEALSVADRIVARACAARALGATAQMHRAGASELERQAERAERLLFGRAVESCRAAAAENRLVADALDAMDGK